METIAQLMIYKNRQVVLNKYEDGLLLERDGFLFEELEISDEEIIFYKEEIAIKTISLIEYPLFIRLAEFSHYYAVTNHRIQLQLYFP